MAISIRVTHNSRILVLVACAALTGVIALVGVLVADRAWFPRVRLLPIAFVALVATGVVAGRRVSLVWAIVTGAAAGLVNGLVDGAASVVIGPGDWTALIGSSAFGAVAGALLGGVGGLLPWTAWEWPRVGPWISAVLFIGIIWVGFILLALSTMGRPFGDRRFAGEAWNSVAGRWEPDNIRGSMINDVQERVIRPQMQRGEVARRLGEPDFAKSDSLWSYNIGMWTGFRMDYDSFDVVFDSSGKVLRTKVVQH